MDRRNFFKLVGTASGGALTGACGKQAQELIPLLVPATEIVPGAEEWHPSVCSSCAAGCGTIVRVMQAERKIEVEGETVRQPIAAIKKIEGNPLDPVSGGRLCARGQAAVQGLYHPDRLTGPRRRAGARGSGDFELVDWETALSEVAAVLAGVDRRRIVYLTSAGMGTGSATAARFLDSIGAPPATTIGVNDFTVERRASQLAFGWDGLPVYEIQDATYVLSIGADFLGGWASPVFYSRRFGHMRRGRPGIRGKLVHAESRFSQTAWSADRWLPVAPGGEHALAMAIGHVIVSDKLRESDQAGESLRQAFVATDFSAACKASGLEEKRIRDVARELASSMSPLVLAGASIVRPGSSRAVTAANELNLLLGNIGAKGGVMPPASLPGGLTAERPAYRPLEEQIGKAEVVMIDGVNPLYAAPWLAGSLAKVELVISFAGFLDDSAAHADWILPDHHELEASAGVIPLMSPTPALTGAPAFVKPLHETRATPDVLVDLARRLDAAIEPVTLDSAYASLHGQGTDEESTPADFIDQARRQGGWWERERPADAHRTRTEPLGDWDPPVSDPAYPFAFQPYPTLQFGFGGESHLPWLQQLPDPASSAVWNLPVEVDPATAEQLDVRNGDTLRVISPSGELEAPVYVNPAAIPGVVSMPIGQGHGTFGRYASGQGANPLSIVDPVPEQETGVPAFGATRVRLEKGTTKQRLVQYAAVDRQPHPHR
ncbi:MAG: molybdopterin-dependent oxidoreductase [Bryobacterales bacterium]|nr:molybdopterin-dependent oxidoreductase [Bryobacterales bacterium]MDE0296809.1 molybdopterin-dependent oxidoreductase [Bryobacterales bacterium]MDE0436718.1 molybdopterin-dependent oxidoreductase [Bryobacterales bacterium]